MTVAERVNLLRKSLGLTQEEFGKPLGLKKAAISRIENGSSNLTETVIKLICREYNICREWLEDGIEPMHPTQELNDIALITRAMEGQNENKKELIRMLASMPDELLDQFVEYLKTYLL